MQAILEQPAGESKLPIAGDTTFGGADRVPTDNPAPGESLRHSLSNGKTPTAKTPNSSPNESEIDIRLQILQQAIKDFAAVAEKASVQIAALPQKQATAIILLGVGYCRNCGTLYNGFDQQCINCGSAAIVKS